MPRTSETCHANGAHFAPGTILAAVVLGLSLAASASALDKEALLRRANEAFLQGRIEEALTGYRQVADAEPRDAAVLYNVAVCLERLGRPDQARVWYGQVLDLEAGHARAAEALKRLRKAGAGAPGEAARQAHQAFLMGRLDQAVAAYEGAIRQDPGDARLRYNLAICYERRGETAAAVEAYRRVLSLEPGHPGAQEALRRLVPEKPPASSLEVGDQRFLQGEYRDALEAYRAQEASGEADAPMLYRMGLCHERLGERKAALQKFRSALKLDPRFEEAKAAVVRLEAESRPAAPAAQTIPVPGAPAAPVEPRPEPPAPQHAPAAEPAAVGPEPAAHEQTGPAPQEQLGPAVREQTEPEAPAKRPEAAWLLDPSRLWMAGALLLAAAGGGALWMRRRSTYVVRGLIPQFAVADVLQILAQNHKTGVLRIDTVRGSARIYLDSGRISAAAVQAQSGERAIYTILSLKEGRFVFKESPRAPKTNRDLKLSIEHALLNWAYEQDVSSSNKGLADSKHLHRN
jgi:tetratricopeptide (TPR) repeat protein